MEQRSDEWHEIRRGKFTASNIHKFMGVKGLGKTGLTYIDEVVADMLSDESEDERFENKAMRWGLEWEPVAAAWYAKAFNKELNERGFVLYSKYAGASPDRLIVGEKKGIEIKCPFNRANHLKHLKLNNAAELKVECPEYYWQIMFNILCIDYESWDFVSFDPRYREDLKLFALEVKRNDEDCKLLEQRLGEAIEIKNNILKRIV
jgi:putative phage-type endonuclease